MRWAFKVFWTFCTVWTSPKVGHRCVNAIFFTLFLRHRQVFEISWNTVVAERVRYFAFSYSLTPAMNWYFVLLNYSFKSWSIIKTRDSFRICLSWGFQNTPWKLNLMKIWLSKSRSKAFYPFLNNVCYGISYEWNHRENMIL